MGTDKQGSRGLDAAYALETPEDSVSYYGEWARDYDREFAQTMGYVFPREVARRFRENGGTAMGPVLDVGAGTGLLGEQLKGDGLVIDAIDISAEMLEVARAKGLYRHRIRADLTKRLPLEDATYGGIVSSGTFTHGHVGAEALDELVRVARPGALFSLSILPALWESKGFASAFARLGGAGVLSVPQRHPSPIYEGVEHEHAADTSEVVVFRKL